MVFYLHGQRWKLVLYGLALLVALMIVQGLAWQGTVEVITRLTEKRLLPIYEVSRSDRVISISLDAVWGVEFTDGFLELFEREGIKTTFFLGGYWLEKYPEHARKIVAHGHEIGNHTYSHPHLNSLSPQEIRHELERNHALIVDITGFTPTLFRPPFGEYSNKVIEAAASLGYQTIQWSIDSLDWRNPTVEHIVHRIQTQVRPGSIILFHNNGRNTLAALKVLIPWFKAQGYRVVPISELIYHENYYIDANGVQRPLPLTTPQEEA
ncbi:MAG: polysaccharide deacetylase family protein [Firmicutes bacterium]|nr:polysaccharide deacetylase family protein [Bacillota bacterium]